ncbi:hypothetical protein B7463_g11150, partial [Scytalidium lignicola]
MHTNCFTIAHFLLATIITVAFPVQCKQATKQGFTFPRASDPSVPNVANMTVRQGDRIIVEYTELPYTTTVSINQFCYSSVSDAIGNETSNYDYVHATGPYDNTGRIQWDFTNDFGHGFCQFVLFNSSIASCSVGLFSVYSMALDPNYTIPLFYSPVFEVLAQNTTQPPVEWINGNATASSSLSSSIASTTVSVTCPQSGIPPEPTPKYPRTLDFWPPLGENVVFPV